MQRGRSCPQHRLVKFQSSPAPRSGCNRLRAQQDGGAAQGFNPHPLRGAGATYRRELSGLEWSVSILTRSEERVQRTMPRRNGTCRSCFNPHPLRGAGATRGIYWPAPAADRFNPHPLRGAGATESSRAALDATEVSILTRSEERVQHAD